MLPVPPCTPGLRSCCSQLGEGQLLTLGPANPGCCQECSVHPWGTVTDSTKKPDLTAFWEHISGQSILSSPFKASWWFQEGTRCLCSSAGFVAALFLPLSYSKRELQPCLVL